MCKVHRDDRSTALVEVEVALVVADLVQEGLVGEDLVPGVADSVQGVEDLVQGVVDLLLDRAMAVAVAAPALVPVLARG